MKLIIKLKIPYRDKQIHLDLPILKYRGLRGDMIEVFVYDETVFPHLPVLQCRQKRNIGST